MPPNVRLCGPDRSGGRITSHSAGGPGVGGPGSGPPGTPGSRVGGSGSGRWGLGPAQFVQALVVDAEVVGNLVDHGDGDLLDDVLGVVAHSQRGVAKDGDAVTVVHEIEIGRAHV